MAIKNSNTIVLFGFLNKKNNKRDIITKEKE